MQTNLPNGTSRSLISTQYRSGSLSTRAAIVCSGVLVWTYPQRLVTRWTWTSTAIAGRPNDPSVAEAVNLLSEHLRRQGCEIRLPRASDGDAAGGGRFDDSFARGSDLVVAIGGDGTMLHAARAAAIAGVAVLGVNRGRLGFLADVSPERMIESVADALADRCQPDARMLLSASVPCSDGPKSALALNDVAIAKHDTVRQMVTDELGDGLREQDLVAGRE